MEYIEGVSYSSLPLLLPHPFVEAPMLTLPPAPTIETLTIRPWPDDVIDTWRATMCLECSQACACRQASW